MCFLNHVKHKTINVFFSMSKYNAIKRNVLYNLTPVKQNTNNAECHLNLVKHKTINAFCL